MFGSLRFFLGSGGRFLAIGSYFRPLGVNFRHLGVDFGSLRVDFRPLKINFAYMSDFGPLGVISGPGICLRVEFGTLEIHCLLLGVNLRPLGTKLSLLE